QGARRNKMKAFSLHLSRLYSLAKATLALIGLAAVFTLMLLPSERHLLRNTLPGLVAEAAEDATAGGAARPGPHGGGGGAGRRGAGATRARRVHLQALAHRGDGRHQLRLHRLSRRRALFGRPRADPVGGGHRIAVQPGRRERGGGERADADYPEIPPRQASRPRRRGSAA